MHCASVLCFCLGVAGVQYTWGKAWSNCDHPVQEFFRAPGERVHFLGSEGKLSGAFIEWVFQEDQQNQEWKSVLDNHVGSPPNTYTPYECCVTFFSENGSITLHNLKKTYTGCYIYRVNLTDSKAIYLRVIEPLSRPFIVSNSTPSSPDVELQCSVTEGDGNFTWRRDGMELSANATLWNGNRSLRIAQGAEEGICHLYKCIVQNPVSSVEVQYIHSQNDALKYYEGALYCGTVALTLVLFYCVICCISLWKMPGSNSLVYFQYLRKGWGSLSLTTTIIGYGLWSHTRGNYLVS
nr:PREDICTED: HEPACAM family member 2-like [Latimeria chalumnae]|eukprot:XP_006005306.2 PREDICTED: HEPACAM family member 2-like [Latimeria chalumnae]